VKLLTIDCREIGGRPGVVFGDDDILDLAAAPVTFNQAQWIPYSVVSVLAAGRDGLERVNRLLDAAHATGAADRDELRRNGVLLPLRATDLLPPVRRPGLLLVAEPDGGSYVKSPNAAVGSAATVAVPWNDDAPLECRGMLAAVLGRSIYRANRAEAGEAIVGYTLVLDLCAGAADDRRRHIESGQFPGANPMGPAIITGDEFLQPQDHRMRLQLNGVEVASEPAYGFGTDIADRVADLSQRYSFRPGDLVCFEPGREAALGGCRLHPGDAVRLALSDVMALDITIRKD